MNKNNGMKKADKILSSIDQNSLQKGIDKLKNMSDAESARLKKQLDSIDKDKVLEMFNSLSPQQIKKKLSSFDPTKLDALKNNPDIIEKLKKNDKQR